MARRSSATRNGLAVFDLLRRHWHGDDVILCAFDLLDLHGEDLRRAPIEERKGGSGEAAAPRPPRGIVLNDTIPATARSSTSTPARSVAKVSCRSGWGSPYRAGRADCWIKVENPAAPAVTREARGGGGELRAHPHAD